MITEKFKLHITDGMVRFDEIIEINEDNDIAYMKVPLTMNCLTATTCTTSKMVRSWLEGHLLL